MQYNEYNNYYLNNAFKNFKYNPYYSIAKLEDYIITYPNDFFGYLYLSQIFIDVGEFDKAKSLFQLIDYVFPDNGEIRVIYHKLRLLNFIGDYESAKDLFWENRDELMTFDPRVEMLETFYDVIDGKKLERNFSSSYLYNQMVDYKEIDFLSHMRKHLADFNKDLDDPNPAVFNSYFPVDRVLDELKTIVPNDNRSYIGLYTNYYVFKYDNAGRVSHKPVDYFRLVTIHGTNSFITMYPMHHGEGLSYIDLNYLNDCEDSNVKQLSRVDKFYNRYGNSIKK